MSILESNNKHMKNEIKFREFRVWDIIGKEMLELVSLDFGLKPRARTEKGFLCDGEFELMQYTGLKDRYSKEIYEGDILLLGHDRIVEVKWDTEIAGFCPFITWEAYEIIGNIYENPELIK